MEEKEDDPLLAEPTSRFRLRNPIKHYYAEKARKRKILEIEMLRKEELMKEDVERFLMQIQEHHSWVTLQLPRLNYQTIVRRDALHKLKSAEAKKHEIQETEILKEDGIGYFRGAITSYKKWQNSAAKHYDFKGHENAVYSVKLSPCMHYVLSCSEDRTARLWVLKTGQCIKIYRGHTKVVTDCDFHNTFKDFCRAPCILTSSGDGTLRLWNTVKNEDATLVTIVRGHQHGVFRCCFSPDGATFASCSEDKSVRLWSFPEGYLVHLYRAHTSPVTALSFSPTGRYLISGSDYGERKLLLWDAKLDSLMTDPKQFPHIIFWSQDGLIKKIIIRQGAADPTFWLAKGQHDLLTEESGLELWEGELEPEEDMPDESEDEDDEDRDIDMSKLPVVELPPGDVRQLAGVSVYAVVINSKGEKTPATEYNPGGCVFFTIQSQLLPISELYIDVLVKDKRYDSFVDNSGLRIGEFKVDAIIPWKPEDILENAAGNKTNYRKVPLGLIASTNNQAVVYKETIRLYAGEERDSIKNNTFDICWECPENPELGTAVVSVNFKLRQTNASEERWMRLAYTLNESPVRVKKKNANDKAEDKKAADKDSGQASEGFTFDLADRHRTFFEYVRDKKWDSVASYLDKKSVLYIGKGYYRHHRQWRVMNELASLFDGCEWMIVHSPFVHSHGQSRSAALCDTDADMEDGDDANAVHHHQQQQQLNAAHQQHQILDGNASTNDSGGGTSGTPVLQPAEQTQHGSDPILAQGEGDGSQQLSPIENENMGDVNPNLPDKEGYTSLVAREPEEEKVDEAHYSSASKMRLEGSHDLAASEDSSNHRHREEELSAKVRPKAKPLKLPKMVFIKPVEGKKFDAVVKSHLKREADSIEALRRSKSSIAEEVRLSALEVPLLSIRRRLATLTENSPPWVLSTAEPNLTGSLSSAEATTLRNLTMKRKQFAGGSTVEQEAESVAILARPTSHALVKKDRFGPEVEEFTMPLPQLFPKFAGQSKHAVMIGLKEYETLVNKHRAKQLPSTLDDVYEPTTTDRLRSMYHYVRSTKKKLVRKVLEHSVESDVRMSVFAESVYESQRRPSCHTLEGIQPHYPNKLCQPDAILTPSMDFIRDDTVVEKKTKRKLFPTAVIALPVGRKPNPEDVKVFASMNSDAASETIGSDSNDDNTIKKKEKEKKISKSKVRYPPDFYTGRRGVFPFAPGLLAFETSLLYSPSTTEEEFLNSEAAKKDKSGVITNSAATSSIAKANDHAKKKPHQKNDYSMDSKVQNITQYRGLLKRFDVRGFEIAHAGSVNDAVFSPSEQRVATAGGDGLVKLWDPRDGSYVKRLQGHKSEVFSVRYSSSEQFLVSAGADSQILVWSMLSLTIVRRLLGHSDVVYSLAMDGKCSVIVSGSHDQLLKSWYTTPRHPEEAEPPRIVAVTDTTAHVSWVAPPSFNLEACAFHMQYRIGLREKWSPSLAAEEEDTPGRAPYIPNPNSESEGFSIAPQFRSMIVKNLIAATSYQFRVRAENHMGLGQWSQPSKAVRTEYGIPEAFDRPAVCGISSRSMSFFWFAQNPKTFGSASSTFEIQCKGNGKSFEEHETLSVSMENARAEGAKLLEGFKVVRARHLTTQNILVRSTARKIAQTFILSADLPDFENYISIEKVEEVIEKVESQERTVMLVMITFTGLRPGFMYLFRTRGLNVAGAGSWSEETYSNFTLPVAPTSPSAPRIKNTTLRSIEFMWDEPDDGGSAITAFQIHLKNIDKEITLSRSDVSYMWSNLFPGKSYFVRVRAMNVCGWSEYSPWNDISESYTTTAAPEKPRNPLAVSGTWHSIDLEITIPYNNGALVTSMEVQLRYIEPFDIGEWQRMFRPDLLDYSGILHIHPNRDPSVTVVQFVDLEKQQDELEQALKLLELDSLGFNPYGKGNKKAEELLMKQKPDGSRIRFTVGNLKPDTMYEFRVRFINNAGKSEFSLSSHRAKTNKASAPGVCVPPTVTDFSFDYCILEIDVPSEGGSHIHTFIIEVMNLEENSTVVRRLGRNVSDTGRKFLTRINDLLPQSAYVFRCKAESAVGESAAFSDWSNEIETLALDGIPAAPILAKPQQVRFAPSTSEKKG